jgi:hypothetical protein
MKKAILLLLTLGLIAGLTVACGGSDVDSIRGAEDIASLLYDFDCCDCMGGDFSTDDGLYIDRDSDITFDDINIILPNFDEPCYDEELLRIKAEFFAAGVPEGMIMKAARFNTWEDTGYFISHDGSFAFKTDENTEVILEDGNEFIGDEFDGRRIVVIYPDGISTRMIPEMVIASKLIVLYESVVPVRY